MTMLPEPDKGEKQIILEVTDLAFDGKSVGHHEGKVIFLNAGLPGERVRAEITRAKPRYSQARVLEILQPSPDRIIAPCTHFGYCGGCAWQDLAYDHQLQFKQSQVQEILTRIGKLDSATVAPILGAGDVFAYRNKMEFSFDADPADASRFTLGLHETGRFDKIFDLNYCHLADQLTNDIVAFMRDFAVRHSISSYNVARHTGYLRFLVVRRGVNTGQYLVNVVTNTGVFPFQDEFVARLTNKFPAIISVVHNRTGRKSNIAVGEIETVLHGGGYFEEQLSGLIFSIRSNAFFQTNTKQAERLYQTGFELARLAAEDSVLDLYCGTGVIGLLLARSVREVVGVELVADAVVAAKDNAQKNGISNALFVHSDVKQFLTGIGKNELSTRFTTFVVDPPRAGMHPKVLKAMVNITPSKILYISCNPATFARDAYELVRAGYKMSHVVPVDMFPHTKHIEVVAAFHRD